MGIRGAASSSPTTTLPPASSSAIGGDVASLTTSLTGLRGVLIIWVVTEHFMDRTLRHPYGLRFSTNTWIFCLLSGFTAALQVSKAYYCAASPACLVFSPPPFSLTIIVIIIIIIIILSHPTYLPTYPPYT